MTGSRAQRDGEAAAEAARHELGLGLDAPISVLDAVEELASIPVCVQSFPNDVAGLFYRRRDRSYLFVNGDHPVERQRFTLAHEFGHVRMHHRPRVESQALMWSKDPQETRANYFAGAFLAPKQAVRNWHDRHADREVDLELVVRMGAFFGISAEASRIRLQIVGATTAAGDFRLKEQIASKDHYGLLGAMGLSGYADSLSRIQRDVWSHVRDLPRLPSILVAGARRAREQGLLEEPDLATILRGEPIELVEEDELAR